MVPTACHLMHRFQAQPVFSFWTPKARLVVLPVGEEVDRAVLPSLDDSPASTFLLLFTPHGYYTTAQPQVIHSTLPVTCPVSLCTIPPWAHWPCGDSKVPCGQQRRWRPLLSQALLSLVLWSLVQPPAGVAGTAHEAQRHQRRQGQWQDLGPHSQT